MRPDVGVARDGERQLLVLPAVAPDEDRHAAGRRELAAAPARRPRRRVRLRPAPALLLNLDG